ncbi:MAG: nucleotidyltransferase domain-containing protein [Anaerolineae bacterium]
MSDTLNYLQPHEQMAVNDYVNRLHFNLGDNLMGLWLFGSKLRGDFDSDSDIDLLVVLKILQPATRWRIREIAARCSLEHDVLFNTHILDQARWEEEVYYQSTLWREIQRDGVSLPLMQTADAPDR